jgi:hypothetical protein
MRECIFLGLSVVVWAGCSGPVPVVREWPAPAPASAAAKAERPVAAPAAAAAPAPAEPARPESPPVQQQPAEFPPPHFAAPFKRTAQPGDGVWTAAGDSGGLCKSTVHPHPIKGFVYVAVVAIDLRSVELHLVAGTREPDSRAAEEKRTGLIPAEHHVDLLAVFNGGFMTKHGSYGVMIGGHVFVPPRQDACAIGLFSDGRVGIAPWGEMQGGSGGLVAYRQTPQCLMERGVLHADLDSDYGARKWGSTQEGKRDTRRSAIGLDASGQVLLYGLGEWTTAKDLAVGMKAAGSVVAAELDINWSYTRFLFFGRPSAGEPLQVVSTLVPKTEHSRMGYVGTASEKDFFYLRRRAAR